MKKLGLYEEWFKEYVRKDYEKPVENALIMWKQN